MSQKVAAVASSTQSIHQAAAASKRTRMNQTMVEQMPSIWRIAVVVEDVA
jgi:hypothetical protein